jgi:hypothetical protein
MIQANELRIGNWVGYHTTNFDTGESILEYIRCIASTIKDVNLFGKHYEPIPLTPEIMVMAGFGKGGEGFYYKNGIEYNLDEQLLEGIGDVPLQYVHQLQNLYFALTGQELTINL